MSRTSRKWFGVCSTDAKEQMYLEAVLANADTRPSAYEVREVAACWRGRIGALSYVRCVKLRLNVTNDLDTLGGL